MRREPHIPLFLWVTTAIVVHALGGGGATEIVQQLEETMDIGSFASDVRRQASSAGKPVEVSFEEEALPEESEVIPDDSEPQTEDSEEPEPADREIPDEQLPKEKQKELEKEAAPEKQKEKEEPKKEVDLNLEKEKPKIQPPVVNNRRIAVEQHVEDKNQEDNPNAQFAGEHANRVAEETQAQITATDQNNANPSMGSNFAGEAKDPGNSNDSRVAQSDENDGAEDRAPSKTEEAPPSPSAVAKMEASQMGQAGAPRPTEKSPEKSQNSQTAQEAESAKMAQSGMEETMATASGRDAIARAQEEEAARKAQMARRALLQLRKPDDQNPLNMFGYGANGTTASGVNLNLNHALASQVVGVKAMDKLREEDGKRRLSQHRGSWTSVGLERWRPALENYVASVKPGNQTALNTARVPFARYLNQIHQQLHEIFAHDFLGHLDQLPPNHPLNNQEMSTHMEIALSREDGRIVRLGITKSSGVTAFDVGALEAVKKAAPYGVPPGSIVSADGNVYLHWEFHRKPDYACSTYFARPYIIDGGQESAPPRVTPPRPPNEQAPQNQDERSGTLEKDKVLGQRLTSPG